MGVAELLEEAAELTALEIALPLVLPVWLAELVVLVTEAPEPVGRPRVVSPSEAVPDIPVSLMESGLDADVDVTVADVDAGPVATVEEYTAQTAAPAVWAAARSAGLVQAEMRQPTASTPMTEVEAQAQA